MAMATAKRQLNNHHQEERKMKVWIDQELCTGDALCEDLCPEMFVMGDDSLAYVKDGDTVVTGGAPGTEVPAELQERVLDAAGQCAGECIFTQS